MVKMRVRGRKGHEGERGREGEGGGMVGALQYVTQVKTGSV